MAPKRKFKPTPHGFQRFTRYRRAPANWSRARAMFRINRRLTKYKSRRGLYDRNILNLIAKFLPPMSGQTGGRYKRY